ncbi:hypothetical protein Tco_1421740 [Tanacetum coccineum]
MPIPTPAEIDVTNLAKTIQMSIATQRSIGDFKAWHNVEKIKEHMMDEELEQLLEGTHNVDAFMDDVLNSKKDPDIRIEPRSDKESPKVMESADILTIHDEEVEEESAGDEFELRKREKRKGIEETRDTPLPTPIRSPKTHIALLSSDKETLQELTITTEDAPSSADKEKLQELTVTDSTSSSSSPKPKTRRFRQYKSFIQQMGERYGYMFGRLKKHFLPRKNIPSHVDLFLKNYMENNILQKRLVPLYVAEGLLLDEQKTQADVAAIIMEAIQKECENLRAKITLQVNNAISNSIPLQIKFEKPTPPATPCRIAAIRLRDHDDHHKNALPEGVNSVKRQKHDDEVPTEEVSQELMEGMLGEIDESQLQKAESKKESLSLPTSKKPKPIYHSCQRDPKAPPMTLLNQDLFYLKYGNSGPKKYTLSLHKYLTVPFPDDDIEERTLRWVNKHIKRQKEKRDKPEEVYLDSKIVEVIRTLYELGHEHQFITEIIVRRANGKIDPIT